MKAKTIFLLIAAGCFSSCSYDHPTSCDDLKDMAADQVFSNDLLSWIDKANMSGALRKDKKLADNFVLYPGEYRVLLDPNLASEFQSKFVVARVIVAKDGKANSVFIGDALDSGLIVKLSDSNSFGVPSDQLQIIAPRIGVTMLACNRRD